MDPFPPPMQMQQMDQMCNDSRGFAEAQGYCTMLETLTTVGLRALYSLFEKQCAVKQEDHSSCFQESLILTPQRQGIHGSIANCIGKRGCVVGGVLWERL